MILVAVAPMPDGKDELLHPAHESVDDATELKREMGPIAFSAQYQQTSNPSRRHDHQEKMANDLRSYGIQPGDRIVISWDIALSEIEDPAIIPPVSCF